MSHDLLDPSSNSLTGSDPQAEADLYRALTDQGADVIYSVSAPDGVITGLSPAFTLMTGWEPTQWLGKPFHALIHPDDLPLALKHFQQTLTGQTRTLTELRLRGRSGNYVVSEVTAAPQRDAGQVVGVVGIVRNITSRRHAEALHRAVEAQRQAQELFLLDHVRAAIIQELDLTRIFRTVVEAIAQTFGYTQVSLYLLQNEMLEMQHQVGYHQVLGAIPATRGIMGRVARMGHPVLLEDVATDPEFIAAIPGVVSEVCVPLYDEDRVAGVLNVESTQGVHLTGADLRLMTALSEHIGLAIGRARLYTTVRESEQRLRRQNEELAALHATALDLIDQLDPNILLEAILARAAALAGTAHGFIYTVTPGTGVMVVRVGIGIFADQIGYRIGLAEGLAGRVWERGELLTVTDYSNWPGRRPDLQSLGIRAICGIPLRSGATVVGVIGLAHQEPDRLFLPHEIAILSHFGELASLALENARLYEAVQQELEERKRTEKRLEHLALYDPLTNLPNRVLFRDRLQQVIASAGPANAGVGLLIMDLDRFKEVNDTLGHDLGDRLLRQVGERLAKTVRAGDMVARLGGDEFAVVLPGAEIRCASRIARRLLKAVAQSFSVDDQRFDIGVSIGIALYPDHGADVDTLLRRGDVAMYEAKRQSRGYAVYAADHDPYSPDRLMLIGDLRKAIAQDAVVLYYQPKKSLRTGRITGVEALARWPHPQRGLLAPGHFLPLAEHTGLIKSLSQLVLNAALRQCRAWHDSGVDLPIAVNLAMTDLHDPRLPDTVARLLDTWGVAPEMLRVEITEGSAMADPARTLNILTRLRRIGVELAIDDFGTGHSSLAHLRQLPVTQIKIDKSFVSEMRANDSDPVIVRATIDLGHNLGLSVVAEGVEDGPTWDWLTRLGCDEGQGFYLTPPLPPAALLAWLQGHAVPD